MVLALWVFPLGAVDIAEQELEKVSGSAIEFLNYVGPHDKVETDAEIRSIGFSLNRAIAEGEEGALLYRGGYFDKYRIIHVVAPPEEEGLNADIFIIDAAARVDHIDNIRRIISAYIEEAYSISRQRSDALATFVTYYNAVHRGDMEYISQTYNKLVTAELDPAKAGISRRYDEWPGKSQLLIPLTEPAGASGPAVETLGGDEKVVEELRKQEDRGIEDRKEMVEMREEQLDKEREVLEEEKQRLEEKKPVETLEDGGTAADTARAVPGDEAAAAQDEDSLGGDAEQLSPEGEKIAEKEKELAQREEKIAAEREQIAEDQEALIEEERRAEAREEAVAEREEPAAAAVPVDTFPFILIEERDGTPFGTLVMVDRTGSVTKRSSMNTLRSRSVVSYKGLVLSAAGEDSPPRTVRLVSLDRSSLEMVNQSDVDVFDGTAIVIMNDAIFCVVREGNSYYLGRFNEELRLELKSEKEIARYSSIQPVQKDLLVQGADGGVLFLDPDTLE